MYEILHSFLSSLTAPIAVVIEFISLFVAVVTILKACYQLFFVDKLDFVAFNTRTTLPSGMISSLEIMLMAEILKLLRVVEFREVIIIFFLIIIHIFLSHFLKRDVKEKIRSNSDQNAELEPEEN